jgi:ribose 5-phosphate isomerase A
VPSSCRETAKKMNLREEAAHYALRYVRDGMILGLGTGATAARFVDMVGERLRTGELRDLIGVPTSEDTAARARALGIPLTSLRDHSRLDLAVDGADEVDPDLNLIKGLGRALLREKIIEVHADQLVVVADESKLVHRLGTRGPLPVEIIPFAAEATIRWLNTLGCCAELWCEENGARVVTDNGNNLARCWFSGGVADPYALSRTLADRPGVVEHGLFLDMAALAIVATSEGIRVLERAS